MHLPMDVILTQPNPPGPDVLITPGKGLNATFVGTTKTPTVLLDGPHGGNVFIPNDNNLDVNFFNLGNDSCATNFSSCQNGFTLSVWFKVHKHGGVYNDIINCKGFQCMAFTANPAHYDVTCGVLDPRVNMVYVFGNMTDFPYDWHVLAMTYSHENGIKVYMDGCEGHIIKIKTKKLSTGENLLIGCRGTKNCVRIQYDDLLIWHEEKPNRFIWQYYHQQ